MMDAAIVEAIGDALGVGVRSTRPVGGGDSSDAWRVELDDDTVVFAKTDPDAVAGLFASEADGLRRLAATGTVRVPGVLAVADRGIAQRFIVLGWIEPGRPGDDHDDELGRSLAALHRTTAPRFGLDHDNHLGRRPQVNTWCDTWAELYGRYRLAPITRLAADAGVLSDDTVARIDRLIGRLPELVGPPEPPALVHGDLWAGNALVDSDGRPWLIDPAVSYSHRELDLAMMRLFGGFGPAVFAAYAEAFPLTEGWVDRVELHQLYYLLVHTLHPSPAGDVGAVDHIVRRYT
ncbi:MAG: fructosamine kinase family protein [Acidimicrobiales bacterium]